jgi:hypothetical protein
MRKERTGCSEAHRTNRRFGVSRSGRQPEGGRGRVRSAKFANSDNSHAVDASKSPTLVEKSWKKDVKERKKERKKGGKFHPHSCGSSAATRDPRALDSAARRASWRSRGSASRVRASNVVFRFCRGSERYQRATNWSRTIITLVPHSRRHPYLLFSSCWYRRDNDATRRACQTSTSKKGEKTYRV